MSDQVPSGGNGGILASPRLVTSDLKMIARAIREDWPVSAPIKSEVVESMREIVKQRSIPGFDKEGNVVELSNARNQTVAARVLVAADAVSQTDYWNADKNERLDAGKLTERIEGAVVRIEG